MRINMNIYLAVWHVAVFVALSFLTEANRGQTRKIETQRVRQRPAHKKQQNYNTDTVERDHFASTDYVRIR